MMVNWSNMYSNSFYNMLTPDSTVDDVVNFVRSRDGIENTLFCKKRGRNAYIFTSSAGTYKR